MVLRGAPRNVTGECSCVFKSVFRVFVISADYQGCSPGRRTPQEHTDYSHTCSLARCARWKLEEQRKQVREDASLFRSEAFAGNRSGIC